VQRTQLAWLVFAAVRNDLAHTLAADAVTLAEFSVGYFVRVLGRKAHDLPVPLIISFKFYGHFDSFIGIDSHGQKNQWRLCGFRQRRHMSITSPALRLLVRRLKH